MSSDPRFMCATLLLLISMLISCGDTEQDMESVLTLDDIEQEYQEEPTEPELDEPERENEEEPIIEQEYQEEPTEPELDEPERENEEEPIIEQEYQEEPTEPELDEPERENEEEPIEVLGPIGDCHTRDELFAFLKNVLACTTGHIHKWAEPPTIRVTADATQKERETVAKALERTNTALPWELEIDPDDAPPEQEADVPEGEIWIEFVLPESPAGDLLASYNRTLNYEMKWGKIWPYRIDSPSFHLHEGLLITLGVVCQTGVEWGYYGTVMAKGLTVTSFFAENGPPGDIDLDVLKAIYAHDIGETPDFHLLPEELCDY